MVAMEQPTRLELARQRLRTAQLVACAGSAAAFVALLLPVKAAHPAQASTQPATGDRLQTQDDDGSFGSGSGSFGPGAGSPQLQTGGS
jgi:hypothetical protein